MIRGGGHFAPPLAATTEDVYDLLVASRFDDAIYAASTLGSRAWVPTRVRNALKEGRFQDAICELGLELFPKWRSRESCMSAYQAAMQ